MALDKKQLQKVLLDKISTAKDNNTTKIQPAAKERLQRFRADVDWYAKKLPNLSQYTFTDTSVMIAVDRITAALMKIVFGNEDIGQIKGRTADDDSNAEIMQQLINWQIEYKNKGYLKLYSWIKECLYQLYSVIKITQRREIGDTEKTLSIPFAMFDEISQQLKQNKAEIVHVEPNQQDINLCDVTVSFQKLVENYPEIENVSADELIWTPGARTLQEADLVGQRKMVTIDHLRRNIKTTDPSGQEIGMYDKAAVAEVAQYGSSAGTFLVDSDLEIDRQKTVQTQDWSKDDPNRKVTIVECYIKYDINGDGLLEDVIATICEDSKTLLRCEENTDGFPFCIISPTFDPFRVVPDRGAMDNLGQWQDLLTAIIRLTVQNLAINNNPQCLVNPASFADFNQVLDNEQFLEVNGDVANAMQPVAQIPLASYTLNLIEMVKGWGEEASTVNRYNQGIDSNSLNKTATGMQLLVNQGSQALELIMRNIAETGMKDLFMRFIFLNQKYIDEEEVVRLTDGDLKVNKDNLSGEFDYMVNSGMGAGAKETDTQNMQTLLNLMPSFIQGGIATVDNAYNTAKKFITLIGIKNTSDYITDPKILAQQAAAQPKEPEAKLSESIQAKITDAPIAIQVQYWQKHGFEATPEMFINNIQMQAAQKAADVHTQSHARQQEAVLNGQIRAASSNPNSGSGQADQGVYNSPVQQVPGGNMAAGNVFPGGSAGGPLSS